MWFRFEFECIMSLPLEEIDEVFSEPGESVYMTHDGVRIELTYEVRHGDEVFMPTFRNIRGVRVDTGASTTVCTEIWDEDKGLALNMIVDRLFE